jgi:multicomponent Na+:H+ antiporter subunit G
MEILRDGITLLLILTGSGFFLAGTIGLLRFPDLCSRLHAVTKADGLGLGFVVSGLALSSPSVTVASKLVLTWVLAVVGSTVACHLIAAHQVEVERDGATDG